MYACTHIHVCMDIHTRGEKSPRVHTPPSFPLELSSIADLESVPAHLFISRRSRHRCRSFSLPFDVCNTEATERRSVPPPPPFAPSSPSLSPPSRRKRLTAHNKTGGRERETSTIARVPLIGSRSSTRGTFLLQRSFTTLRLFSLPVARISLERELGERIGCSIIFVDLGRTEESSFSFTFFLMFFSCFFFFFFSLAGLSEGDPLFSMGSRVDGWHSLCTPSQAWQI